MNDLKLNVKTELEVTTHPAVISANFEVVEAQLKKHLEDYATVVTADTVQDAKKQAADLNKLKAEIDTRRKDAAKAASAPIKAFEDRAKQLGGMVADTRQKIVDQVKRFEAERLDQAQAALIEERRRLFEELSVRAEYQVVDIAPLVKLTALTPKGAVAAATGRELRGLVGECLARQQRVDLRLSQLENESHRAGLASPLTREHVEGFLEEADDAAYARLLGNLITRELERQKAAQKQERERLAREQAERDARDVEALREREAKLPQAEAAPEQDKPDPPPTTPAPAAPVQQEPTRTVATAPQAAAAPAPVALQRRVIEFDIRIEVSIPAGYEVAAVQSMLMEKLASAGVRDSVRSVKPRDVTQREAA